MCMYVCVCSPVIIGADQGHHVVGRLVCPSLADDADPGLDIPATGRTQVTVCCLG